MRESGLRLDLTTLDPDLLMSLDLKSDLNALDLQKLDGSKADLIGFLDP